MRDLASACDVPNDNVAKFRRSCNAMSVRTERGVIDGLLRIEPGYLAAGCDIPQVRCRVPASRQKMHIVRAEDREGWWIVVESSVARAPSMSQSRVVPSCDAVRRILLSIGLYSTCSTRPVWPLNGRQQRCAIDVPDTDHVV